MKFTVINEEAFNKIKVGECESIQETKNWFLKNIGELPVESLNEIYVDPDFDEDVRILKELFLWSTYDEHFNVVFYEEPGVGSWERRYDEFGNVIYDRPLNGPVTTVEYEYDSENRPLKKITSAGFVTNFSYFPDGSRVETITKENGEFVRQEIFNLQGKVTYIKHSDGSKYEAAYTEDGNLIFEKENGSLSKFGYDAKGREILYIAPNGFSVITEYDDKNKIIKKTTSENHTMISLYDDEGRVIMTSKMKDGKCILHTSTFYDNKDNVVLHANSLFDPQIFENTIVNGSFIRKCNDKIILKIPLAT